MNLPPGVPTDGWIKNTGRRPRDENAMRWILLANGWVAKPDGSTSPGPVRVGGYRWTLSGKISDITASRKA